MSVVTNYVSVVMVSDVLRCKWLITMHNAVRQTKHGTTDYTLNITAAPKLLSEWFPLMTQRVTRVKAGNSGISLVTQQPPAPVSVVRTNIIVVFSVVPRTRLTSGLVCTPRSH